MEPQLRGVWCWAASAQMIMTYLQPDRAQEFLQPKLATTEYGVPCPTSNCSALGPTTDCDKEGRFPEFNLLDSQFKAAYVRRALTWDELSDEIAAKRPVAFSWCWRNPGESQACRAEAAQDEGHMMVAAGIDLIDVNVGPVKRSVRAVKVLQPLCCCKGDKGYFTYEEYRQGKGHLHWRDYYCIRAADTSCPVLPVQEPGPFDPDTPAFAGARPAAEAVRSAWLPDLLSLWQHGLGIAPMTDALGEPILLADPSVVGSVTTMLEDEVPVRIVLPGELADSPEEPDLEQLAHRIGLSLFPLQAVSASANAPWLSTIAVRQGSDEKWRLASAGSPLHALGLFGAWKKAQAEGEDVPLMEVRFVGLNVSLLVRQDPENRLHAYPICGACLRWPATEDKLPLMVALKRLRKAARAYHGGPS